ncbi:3-methyladenine DNA glycosylase AlkD [Amycolatopsis arida]|uniref:3-methyladenine DNA glycosylase AlkD n=1 Tax=Amycolatopsis arida TaxID=587909 RepID=A0A1I6AH33_9PSEU|nr:3-methyladenine DNA glycosylase AlkD [Amycolatopsis arida]SFQ68028.1 3-methyladenine DNA glycosylase AlkD [Amycolatopsis arida]
MRELVRAVRAGLAELTDPVRAERMRRYMKSAMPFRGVPAPERRRLARRLFQEHPLSDVDEWLRAVRELWHGAAFREERYVAVDLTGHRAYAGWQTAELVPLYEELIVTGAWWDFVDEIAVQRIGPILRADPASVTPVLRRWAGDEDRWKRRTAVICQLTSAEATDLDLLVHAVTASARDPDFFLRKGIGWALRQYARTDPGWVRSFVAEHPELSALSRREALKHLGDGGDTGSPDSRPRAGPAPGGTPRTAASARAGHPTRDRGGGAGSTSPTDEPGKDHAGRLGPHGAGARAPPEARR